MKFPLYIYIYITLVMVSQLSYLYNGNPHMWKDVLYIVTATRGPNMAAVTVICNYPTNIMHSVEFGLVLLAWIHVCNYHAYYECLSLQYIFLTKYMHIHISLRFNRNHCTFNHQGNIISTRRRGSVQDCSISSALAVEVLQSCTKPLIY